MTTEREDDAGVADAIEVLRLERRLIELSKGGGTDEEVAEVMEALTAITESDLQALGRRAALLTEAQAKSVLDAMDGKTPPESELADLGRQLASLSPEQMRTIQAALEKQHPGLTEDFRLLEECRVARKKRGPRLKLDKGEGGGINLTLDDSPVPTHHRMAALARSIGSDNPEFAKGILGHVVNAANGNEADANFQLAAIQGIAPRDTTESLLAAQMSAAHVATMAAARSLARAETLVQYEAYERAFNKLARTFAAQVEALKRYRSSGSQKVTVEHININDGGRAIVGTVALAPRGGAKFMTNHPMQSKLPMHVSRRCLARTRRGTPCQSPAMPNGRCRMHGGKSPGAPRGNKNAFRHGGRSSEVTALRREANELCRGARVLIAKIEPK